MKNRKRSPRTIKRNFSFHNFLYNDKYILIFSICMAFVIWIIVSSTSSDPDVKTITDISISIPNLSDGLEVMKTEDTKAETSLLLALFRAVIFLFQQMFQRLISQANIS